MPRLDVPVLLVAFNRPTTTSRVLSTIKEAGVSRLYVAGDAPRSGNARDTEKVSEVRRLIDSINWPCEVKTHYQKTNLGCRLGVTAALDWFFSHEKQGIILEDDCLPHPDFFGYCAELLERYRDDERVMTISGDRSPVYPDQDFYGLSYGFSRFPLIWGWATWRRAWKTFDLDLNKWPLVRQAGWLKGLYRSEDVYDGLYDTFEGVYVGRHNTTWDYQWLFNCLVHSGLTIVPAKNPHLKYWVRRRLDPHPRPQFTPGE